MRITAAVAMAAVGTLAALGGETGPFRGGENTVEVYIASGGAGVESRMLAKIQASKMFAQVGVELHWHRLTGSVAPLNAVVIDIVEHAPASECAGALACAKVYEGVHIRVFYDRLPQIGGKDFIPLLLAHVFVHEITHILQGIDRHSDSGIMKAHWEWKDYDQMYRGTLRFAPIDVFLIQRALSGRAMLAGNSAKPSSEMQSDVAFRRAEAAAR
jgi:hypothetical protein